MNCRAPDHFMNLRRACVVQRVAPVLRRFYSISGHSPELRAYLGRHQLNLATVQAYAGVFTVALVRFFRDSTARRIFQFDAEGLPACVMEAYEVDSHSVMDLVAWPIFAPWQYATAIGEAEFLGPLSMVRRNGQPLHVFKTPLDWLKAGCTGCVPLSRRWAGYWLDKAGGPFIAQDMQHGREIREMLGFASKRHRVLAPDNGVAA